MTGHSTRFQLAHDRPFDALSACSGQAIHSTRLRLARFELVEKLRAGPSTRFLGKKIAIGIRLSEITRL
jgi:hypothetical protein